MRRLLISTALFLTAGCGSESTAPDTASSLSLSIGNPSGSAGRGSPAGSAETAATGSAGSTAMEVPAVRQLLQKANAAVVVGQNNVAIEALSQAIGLTPSDPALFRMRADVYVLQREMANARADFSTAVRLDPNSATLLNVRGYFLMTQGLTSEARADFEQAVKLDPAHAPAWNNHGLLFLAAQDYPAALQDFTRAIEADRKFADAWNNRGFARMKLQQNQDALSDIQQALRLKEDYATAWNNRGLVHLQMEDYAAAEQAFSRLIELSPMDARWFNHRRTALLKQEKFAEAQKDARQIDWLNGLNELSQNAAAHASDPRSWINRAEYLMEGQQFGAAIQDFSRALLVNPGNTDALTGRAFALLQTGDLTRAMQDCDEAIVVNATPRAHSVRADIWLGLKNYDQAIADYETAARFDDKVAEAYELRAASYQAANETEKAEADQKKAQQIRDALSGNTPQDASASQPPIPFPASVEQ
jgi:tetratricopeptide (TPR) repeat protein